MPDASAPGGDGGQAGGLNNSSSLLWTAERREAVPRTRAGGPALREESVMEGDGVVHDGHVGEEGEAAADEDRDVRGQWATDGELRQTR